MDKKLQDLAWPVLPKEFKEEVKRMYRIADSDVDQMIATIMLENVFGLHNLTSDAEGEEMLTAQKGKVQTMYDNAIKIIADNPIDSEAHLMAILTKELIRELFGEVGKGDASNVASSEPYVDGFRSNNRLHIATQITASIYSNHEAAKQFRSIEAIVRKALDIADTLIAECELSTQSLCPAKKGGTGDKYFDSPSLFPNEP